MIVRRDLLLAAAIALAVIGLATGWSGLVPIIFGALLALLFPGYAIVCVIAPRGGIAPSERILFALGLSFIAMALGAIALNMTPLGVRPIGWVILLGGVSTTCLVAAAVRRGREETTQVSRLTIEPLAALLLAVAVVMSVGAAVVARAGAESDPSASVVQVWLLPGVVDAGDLEVGLRSSEGGRYRLEIWRGAKKSREWTLIALSSGGVWRKTMRIPAGTGAVEARLYSPDSARRLRIVTVTPPTG